MSALEVSPGLQLQEQGSHLPVQAVQEQKEGVRLILPFPGQGPLGQMRARCTAGEHF